MSEDEGEDEGNRVQYTVRITYHGACISRLCLGHLLASEEIICGTFDSLDKVGEIVVNTALAMRQQKITEFFKENGYICLYGALN